MRVLGHAGERARRSGPQQTVSSMLRAFTTPCARLAMRLRDFATNRRIMRANDPSELADLSFSPKEDGGQDRRHGTARMTAWLRSRCARANGVRSSIRRSHEWNELWSPAATRPCTLESSPEPGKPTILIRLQLPRTVLKEVPICLHILLNICLQLFCSDLPIVRFANVNRQSTHARPLEGDSG